MNADRKFLSHKNILLSFSRQTIPMYLKYITIFSGNSFNVATYHIFVPYMEFMKPMHENRNFYSVVTNSGYPLKRMMRLIFMRIAYFIN